MKKLLVMMAVLFLAMPICAKAQDAGADKPKEFMVYSDKGARDNHYIPSGWMGDYGDVKLNDQSPDNPHSGKTCLQFTYTAKKAQGQGWAGTYWQSQPNNWGTKKTGFDLTGMTKLTFWARGAKGGEIISKFTVGGIKGAYPDTVSVETSPIELTDTWKQYTVNLAGKDMSYVNAGFGWVATSDLNPDGAVFYIDDIKFEADANMKPEGKKQETIPFYVYSDRSSASNHYIPSGWMGDYGDIKIDTGSKEDPYLGDTSIKIIYNNKASQGARWAGIFWQNPPYNWGSIDAGYDLSKATKLTFWARGAKGGERIEEFKVGGIMGEFSDTDSATIVPVILNKDWTQYTIDLKGKDMSYIIGGFCWTANLDNNPDGVTFNLDEIKYE
ncbi:MAG: hypothetical protein NT060_02235 [Candidatus Omnitrophica bacterium]|nr:hypothetical protein [Candidatus Omnitrophota bacterium]